MSLLYIAETLGKPFVVVMDLGWPFLPIFGIGIISMYLKMNRLKTPDVVFDTSYLCASVGILRIFDPLRSLVWLPK